MKYYQDYMNHLVELARGTELGSSDDALSNQRLRRTLVAWARDGRFDDSRYIAFMHALVDAQDTTLCKRLEVETTTPALTGSMAFLQWIVRFPEISGDCWSYRMLDGPRAEAMQAYRLGKTMIDHTCSLLRTERALETHAWLRQLLALYFGGLNYEGMVQDKELTEDPIRAARVKKAVLEVLEHTRSMLHASPQTVVLCKGDTHGKAAASSANETYHPKDGAMILVHDAFFGLSDFEKAITMVHEATHQFAQTKDENDDADGKPAYGRDRCITLSESKASTNADSYALFTGDVYFRQLKNSQSLALQNAVRKRNQTGDFWEVKLQ
jgi:hypothetical protein